MLLAIFGAGASYDSSVSYPPDSRDRPKSVPPSNANSGLVEAGRPPLTDGLFDGWEHPVPAAKSAVEWVRMNRQDSSIEQTLRALQIASDRSAVMKRKLLALRFYLHSVISRAQAQWGRHVTNYDAFLAAVEGGECERVCLLTFNYDTFIDEALARHLGAPLQSDDCNHGRYSLVRCHGSLNWAYEVLTPLGDVVGLDEEQLCNQIVAAEPLELSPLMMFPTNSNPPKGHGKLLLPAIAIPAEPKSDFVCPKEHIDTIATALPQVTKVVIVGWKGAEKSVHEMLLSLPKSVRGLVVSGSESEGAEIITRLALPGSFSAATGGFTRSLYITNEIQKFVES